MAKQQSLSAADLAAARKSASETREKLKDQPSVAQLLTAEEAVDAAPFYFVLREYIRQLKAARESAGLTLADVSARTGIAVESLSRLETGAQTNPTWKTLGLYTAALGCQPKFDLAPQSGQGVLTPRTGLPSSKPQPKPANGRPAS